MPEPIHPKQGAGEIIKESLWKKAKNYLIRKLQDDPDPPARPALPTRKTPGLDCPKCGFRMTVTVAALLSSARVVCPACSLKLTIDQNKSRRCLTELRKVHEVVRRAEEAKRGPSQ